MLSSVINSVVDFIKERWRGILAIALFSAGTGLALSWEQAFMTFILLCGLDLYIRQVVRDIDDGR